MALGSRLTAKTTRVLGLRFQQANAVDAIIPVA